jgi:hypothetical protein
MTTCYNEYSPHLIQTILKDYKRGVKGHGFEALAKKYNVKGGRKLIRIWYEKWDGTEESLEKHSGGDRRSILSPDEKKKHVSDFITKSSKVEAVVYSEVQENVKRKTGVDASITSVKRWGKSAKMSSKKRKRTLKSEGSASFLLLSFRSVLRNDTYMNLFVCRDANLPGFCRGNTEKVSKYCKETFGMDRWQWNASRASTADGFGSRGSNSKDNCE